MTRPARQPVHATLIAARRGGQWRGVLLRGPSGTGKSDLALRALAAGWALVADDRVRLWTSGGALYGSAPRLLCGRIEARGQGVLAAPALRFARIALVVEPRPADAERAPGPACTVLDRIELPFFRLPFLEAGSIARLDLALDAASRRRPRL